MMRVVWLDVDASAELATDQLCHFITSSGYLQCLRFEQKYQMKSNHKKKDCDLFFFVIN